METHTTSFLIRSPKLIESCAAERFRGLASLLRALELGRSSQATEAEDKVFALQRVVRPDQKRDLFVDYNSKAKDLNVGHFMSG